MSKFIGDDAVKRIFSEVKERFVMKTDAENETDAAAYAKEQGDYAKEQGDYAKEQTEAMLGTLDEIEELLDKLNS
jgi:hypothetical protein